MCCRVISSRSIHTLILFLFSVPVDCGHILLVQLFACKLPPAGSPRGSKIDWAFLSPEWQRACITEQLLTVNHRQDGGSDQRLFAELRGCDTFKQISDLSFTHLTEVGTFRKFLYQSCTSFPALLACNFSVDRINAQELFKLDDPIREYVATDAGQHMRTPCPLPTHQRWALLHIIISSYHHIIVSSYHHIIMSSRNHITISPYHHIRIIFIIFSIS